VKTLRTTEQDLQIRRRRLAELLRETVFENPWRPPEGHDGERLHPTVTDSVCSFLGHPRHCPHGRPIPEGECCRSSTRVVEPLVQPLDQLLPGDVARVVYLVPRHVDQLVRLSNLGVVPGAMVQLRQRRPASVLAIGETELALDPEIIGEIYVKRID